VGSDRPRRRARRWRGLTVAFAALVGGAVAEPRQAIAAETAYVRSELRGGRCDSLAIGPRGTSRLTVRATRNASVGRLTLSRDVFGPVHLNADGQPTAGSTNVVDRGLRRWGTRFDLRSTRRDGQPDRGGFEYVAPG